MGCSNYKFQFESEEDESIDSLRIAVSGQIFYYHPDHLGTNTIISNSYGTIHQYFFNLPFGETMVEGTTNSSYPLDYKFNGKEFDAESGLYYYGSRYYDPRLSVWLSVDPLFNENPNFSPFNYCSNNPMNNIDPDGLDDYELTKKGQLKHKCKSDIHTVYVLDKNGKRTGVSQTFDNKGMLDQLAGGGRVTKAIGDENSQDEMVKAFVFFADNTDVEWRIDRYQENKKNKYSLGTLHDPRKAPSAQDLGHYGNQTIAFIHSHPNTNGSMFDEISSMGYWGDYESGKWKNVTVTGDTYNKAYLPEFTNTIYQTYFPSSGRLWNVNKYTAPSYIRNIQNNYKRFFIGNINTR